MTFKDKIDSLFSDLVAQTLEEKKSVKDEDASNDTSDDGEGLDKVDPKALKKKFKNRKDKDLDNDGDTDDSDEYLHKRRQAVSKAIANEDMEDVKEFHAPGMSPKPVRKTAPSSSKKSLSDIRKKADNFKKKDESVELGEESATIAKVKEIVAKKSAMKIDGVMVDMFTASAIAQIYDKVNDANKKKMDGLKITKLADVAMKLMKREELEEKTMCPKCEGKGCDHCDNTGYHEEKVEEAKNYEYKDGKVYISKANFRKTHKDYKNATKGKERLMILDPKTQASISVPVVFTESSFKEKFKRSLSKRLSESAKTEEKSDEVANRYNELKQLAPVELMKLYQKHYGSDDIDKVKEMEKSELISKIVDKEFENQGEE